MRKIISAILLLLMFASFLNAAEYIEYDANKNPQDKAEKEVRLNIKYADYFELGFTSEKYDFKGAPSLGGLDQNGYLPLIYNADEYIAEADINIFWLYGTANKFQIKLSCTALSQQGSSEDIAVFAEYGTSEASSSTGNGCVIVSYGGGNYKTGNSLEADTSIHIYTESLIGKAVGDYTGTLTLEVRND